jgi:hypothetical protein
MVKSRSGLAPALRSGMRSQEFLLLALWRIRGARADGGAGLASSNSACMLLDYRQDGEYDRSSRQDIRASSLLKVE